MLTQLYLKNWRSIREETINFTPITVLIGANASGKTNILDALHFLRRLVTVDHEVAIYNWQGFEKIRFTKALADQDVELDITLDWTKTAQIVDTTTLGPPQLALGVGYSRGCREIRSRPLLKGEEPENDPRDVRREEYSNMYRKLRWQLLRENMMPPAALPSSSEFSDPYLIDPLGHNVPLMLDFMRGQKQDIYEALQTDFRLLLDHIQELDTIRDEREIRFLIRETVLNGKESPTISGGTSRLLAILTAYYALDMRNPEQPGLVVIEEPDVAVHPLLLGNLVDLLRSYTEREQPRQFILTTHNPQILNYFEPHEVRIVERDSDGITTVNPVNEEVAETWRKHEGAYNLGSLWTTRLLGGVPR